MFQRDYIFRSLIAALLLFSVAPVSSKEHSKVVLQCNSAQHPMICKALAEALRDKRPGLNLIVSDDSAPVETDGLDQISVLTISYHEQKRTNTLLSGRLIWQDQEGRRVDGPVLGLTIMDSTLRGKDLSPFAQALVQHSDLPL